MLVVICVVLLLLVLFYVLFVSEPVYLDLLISSLRKLSTKTTETYWPETLNLFAVPKEMEDLSSSDATDTEGCF
jgi:type IV secretory pathway VirB3-like protein